MSSNPGPSAGRIVCLHAVVLYVNMFHTRVKVFFGKSDSPWRAFQLRKLLGEQRRDLETRFISDNSVMFKAVDSRRGMSCCCNVMSCHLSRADEARDGEMQPKRARDVK